MIGWSNDATTQLHDGRISRSHAVMARPGERLTIEDLGSANGTWVTGQVVVNVQRLRPRDIVRLGI